MAGRNGIKEILESKQFPGTNRSTSFKEGFNISLGRYFKTQRQMDDYCKKNKFVRIGNDFRSKV